MSERAASGGQALPADAAWQRPPVRRLAALTLVAALLGLVVAITVLPGLAPPVPTRVGEPLLTLDPDSIREVEVSTRSGTQYRFRREGSGWMQGSGAAGTPVPADRLDGFLASLGELTRLVEIDATALALGEFGLDPPRGTLVLRGAGETTLVLGDRNPPLTALYVQVLPRTNIVLVGAVLLWEFDKLVALARAHSVEP